MKKRGRESPLFPITYLVGTLVGVLFCALRWIGRIRLTNKDRLPRGQKRLIVVVNHPSLLEPFLIPALFFPEYLLHPIRRGPWSTPDSHNFYESWYWFWLRPRAIAVPRGECRREIMALFKARRLLRLGRIVIIFPEGGRTHKGNEHLLSEKRKVLRRLKHGVGWLVKKTGAPVLPIWVENTDKVLPNNGAIIPGFWRAVVTIKIGHLLFFLKTHQLTK